MKKLWRLTLWFNKGDRNWGKFNLKVLKQFYIKYMQHIQECINQTFKHTAELQQFSSKDYFEIGNYPECIRHR